MHASNRMFAYCDRRVNYDLVLVYKILHGLTDCTLSHNLTLQEFNKTRGHPYKLEKKFLLTRHLQALLY